MNVTEVVDRIEVNSDELPWLILNQRGGGGLDGGAISDDLQQRLHPRILLRFVEVLAAHSIQPRKEVAQFHLGEFGWVKAQFSKSILETRRMNGAGFKRPLLRVDAVSALEIVGNHDTF